MPLRSTNPPPDVTLLLPSLGGGGAERVAVSLARAFGALGLRVEFTLMRASGPLLKDLPCGMAFSELKVDRVRHAPGPLSRYLRARRPRSMLVFMWPLNSAAVVAEWLARTGVRMVLSEHTDWARNPLASTTFERSRLSATMRLTYGRAHSVVAVSQGAADSLARLARMDRDAVNVIYNPITPLPPPGDLDPAIGAAWLTPGGPNLIAVGRFHEQKDYPTLLRALTEVRRTVDARLLILGDGPLRGEIEALVAEHGLNDAVAMPGFVPNPQAYLQRADLFVLSAAWEGFGNVIVEALACGTPVVSTDCRSGPREILWDGRFGALTPVGDAPALAAAILAALDKPHDKAALIARSNDFSIDAAARKYLRLLLPDDAERLGA